MKKFFLLFAVVMIALIGKAERVSYKQAEVVAKAYYYQTVQAFRATKYNDINLSCVVNPDLSKAEYNLYIFNVNANDGYIVVSTDNQITPVLAYSFNESFNMYNMSPGQAAYLKYYSECNDYAANNVTDKAKQSQQLWAELLAFNPNQKALRDVQTSPILLDGIVWEQGWPFNCKCPDVKTSEYNSGCRGDHGKVYVGCVATAASHVMKYWSWPEAGNGSISHSSSQNGGYGNVTINLSNQTYDWTAMPDDPGSSENEEIGKLCFHVGAAVKMHWGCDGSGSQTYLIRDALKNYFKYKSTVQYKSKTSWGGSISDADWNAMLKNEIDNKRPMVYSGQPAEGNAGHAWNCDGYQINGSEYKFHMQWGWGARGGNGFYTLDNLNSTATAGGEENNFCERQEAVIGIEPNTSFVTCQAITATGAEGGFDDGSRSANYNNNLDCTYTIIPECYSHIVLTFTKFDLAEGDYLQIYEGASQTLKATFDKDNLPEGRIKTSKGSYTLKFHTDGQNTAGGWRLNYTSDLCEEGIEIELKEPSGTIEDGSKECQYVESKTCKWIINPNNASNFVVDFDSFNVSTDGKDYVGFYKNGGWGNSALVVKFNTSNLPTEPITFNTNMLGVKFYSNGSDVADGFKLTYNTNGVGIADVKILSNLSVMPNPANNDSRIAFTLTDAANAEITITNVMGQIVVKEQLELGSGYYEMPISNFTNEILNEGMYFVSVKNGNEIKTCKFVVAE